MFSQFIDPRQTIESAARDYFLIHPRTPQNIAQIISAANADAATFSEALSLAASRWLEDEATETAQTANLDARCGRDD